ncbi:unnamed protein product [Colias eurytheme]|nr:unnamed protein product [Colias eurytheme]
MFGFLFFVPLIAYVAGQTTQVERCPPGDGDLPINIYLEGCTTMPCTLRREEDAIINVVFKAPRTIRSMKTFARVPFFNIPSYPLGENAATCNHLQNTYCPLQKEEVVQYQLRMYIENYFITFFPVSVDFFVKDSAKNSTIWCATVRILTVAKNTPLKE